MQKKELASEEFHLRNLFIDRIFGGGLIWIFEKTEGFKLNNKEAEDSPGHHLFQHSNDLNYAIRPNQPLASLMELEPHTKYVKMQPRGYGSSGGFIAGAAETGFHLEYAIKKGADFEEVRKRALDSTLLVLTGNKVIAEIPLNKKK